MAKKRKCRLTEEELAIHAEAVRLRKMTDQQLVEQFRRAGEPETAFSAQNMAQGCRETDTPSKDTSAVEQLISALSEGRCKGIKSGIAYKVRRLAEEMGLA